MSAAGRVRAARECAAAFAPGTTAEVVPGMTAEVGVPLEHALRSTSVAQLNAKIDGDNIVVWNDKIPNPVSVRYAWVNNPEGANLCNKKGLPASPFETDSK